MCYQNIQRGTALGKDKHFLSSFSLDFISLSPSVSPSVTCPPLHKLCKMRQSSLQTNTSRCFVKPWLVIPWCRRYPDAGFHCERLPCNKQAQILSTAQLHQLHNALFNLINSWKFLDKLMCTQYKTFLMKSIHLIRKSLILQVYFKSGLALQ